MIGRHAAARSYWSEAITCRAVLNCFYSNSECIHCRRTLTNEIKLRRENVLLTNLLGLIKAMRIISAITEAVRPPKAPISLF